MSDIGFFQFDNLVRNRVPFTLINLGVDLSKLYTGVEAAHIEKVNHHFDARGFWFAGRVVKQIQQLGLPPDAALVVIAEKGSKARSVFKALGRAGFKNCFWLCENLGQR